MKAQTKPRPLKGYRLLRKGELIRANDLINSWFVKWKPAREMRFPFIWAASVGEPFNPPFPFGTGGHCWRCRKVAAKKKAKTKKGRRA